MQVLRCVIGLGSNVGDRRRTLADAVKQLERGAELRAVSALYETAPVGGPPQPAYLNAAVRLDVDRDPEALLESLHAIELSSGRRREGRWGPRTLDLDVLWIAGRTVATPTLTVPHPRLHERAFALVPLLDVVPDATDPRSGAPYSAVANRLGTAGIRRVASPGWHTGEPR